MAVTIAVVAGLILGSFLSVLVGRWDTKKGILTGRSACPDCGHVLAWYDLIPLVSWVILWRRCRYCRAPIPWRYPAMEVLTASVLGLYVWLNWVPTWWMFSDVIILFGLVALFLFDWFWQLLPDAVTFPLIGIVLVRLVVLRPDLLANGFAMGGGLAALLAVLFYASRGRQLGFGDVKFAFLIGILFGYPIAVGVTLVAIWVGALVGIGLMLMHRATLKTAVPFGSFWSAVAIAAVIWTGWAPYLSGLVTPYR